MHCSTEPTSAHGHSLQIRTHRKLLGGAAAQGPALYASQLPASYSDNVTCDLYCRPDKNLTTLA